MKIGSEKKVLSSGITINLKKDTPVVLEIRLAHDGQNFMNFDTLQIIGNDSEINIPISLTGSHVSYQKLNEGTPIHISRIKDRKIIIAQIGTETSISFRGKKINSDLNVSYRGSYIDISDIPNGDFNLLIGSCHISGTLPVTIGE